MSSGNAAYLVSKSPRVSYQQRALVEPVHVLMRETQAATTAARTELLRSSIFISVIVHAYPLILSQIMPKLIRCRCAFGTAHMNRSNYRVMSCIIPISSDSIPLTVGAAVELAVVVNRQ